MCPQSCLTIGLPPLSLGSPEQSIRPDALWRWRSGATAQRRAGEGKGEGGGGRRRQGRRGKSCAGKFGKLGSGCCGLRLPPRACEGTSERASAEPASACHARQTPPRRARAPSSLRLPAARPGPPRPRPPAPRAGSSPPPPGGPSPPPGPAPRRSPALLSPSLPAAEQHGGARAAAARPPAAPLSRARGQPGTSEPTPAPPRPPPHLSHCAPPGAPRTPGTLARPGCPA